ncbi:sodium channel modifier 1 [Eudromia elegans]
MSFKREGDDVGQLGALQKRRVADLLASYIPEEEALLLRSGRYACTVCPHRPVFDTLEVLAVHRAGKKHVAGLQSFYGRKRSLEDEAPKQQHEELAQAQEVGVEGSPAPLLARTRRITQSALLKAAPYSSRCRRTGASYTSKATMSQTQGGGKRKVSPTRQPEALSTDRSQALERYLQLRSAGWIQDHSGKWVKDENAEFDSDEEEPPGLLPA